MNVVIILRDGVIISIVQYNGTSQIDTSKEWLACEINEAKTKLQLAGYDIQPIIDYQNSFNDIENNEG